MQLSPKSRKLLFFSVVFLPLGGCADYLSNLDSVTLGVGSANYANQAVHTIDPFPPVAQNTDIDISPETTDNAYKRYITPGDPAVGGS